MQIKSDTSLMDAPQAVHKKSETNLGKLSIASAECLGSHSLEAIKVFDEWIRERTDIKVFTNSDIDNFFKNL